MTTTPGPGDKVLLARVRDPEFRGRTGTVKRFIKSRNEVAIDVHGKGKCYFAFVENVDVLPKPTNP